MYMMKIVLYGTQRSKELAKDLLVNQKEVARDQCASAPNAICLALHEPMKETSLIPLLRNSGIQGFRLVTM